METIEQPANGAHSCVLYEVIEDRKEIEDAGDCVLYGIVAMSDGVALARVEDVSSRRGTVERLCAACNQLGVAPVHLMDVLEDFLGDGMF